MSQAKYVTNIDRSKIYNKLLENGINNFWEKYEKKNIKYKIKYLKIPVILMV